MILPVLFLVCVFFFPTEHVDLDEFKRFFLNQLNIRILGDVTYFLQTQNVDFR